MQTFTSLQKACIFIVNKIHHTRELDNRRAKLFLFNGSLGSGKTTLIKNILQHLGVQEAVTSPTFGYLNEYHIDSYKIYHLDCYQKEICLEEFQEIFADRRGLIFVEWGEKLSYIEQLDKADLLVEIDFLGDDEREFRII